MAVEIHRLDNGIPLLIDVMRHTEIGSLGIYVRTGTSHETPENNGVAHLLEHMAFKGTKRRSASEIADEVADLGANFNASTNYEMTQYEANGLAAEMSGLIDVVTDIVCNSVIPKEELELERGAVLQEIRGYNDDLADVAHTKAQKAAFPDHPLGFAILGPSENIEKMPRRTLLRFMDSNYHGGHMICSVAGNVDPARILPDLNQTIGNVRMGLPNDFSAARFHSGIVHEDRPTDQVNLSVYFNSFEGKQPERYAAIMMGMILGGDQSSRLYTEARQKRGLVYAINSGWSSYQKNGLFNIVAGSGEDEIAELMPVIADEIIKITQEPVTERELQRTKRRIATDIAGAADSVVGRRDSNALEFAMFGRAISSGETRAMFEAVTASDILRVAQRTFSEEPVISSVGSSKNRGAFDRFQKCLKL